MIKKDFFSYIEDFEHNLGIYFTFTLDKSVISKIRDVSYGRTIILHDYRQGKSLDNNNESRVLCIPVIPLKTNEQENNEHCFHSKMALLKSNNKFRLIVGSMNLSEDSFESDKEICCSIDLEINSPIHKTIIDYFKQISEQIPGNFKNYWKKIITEIEPTESKNKDKSDISFIYNTDNESISDIILDYSKIISNPKDSKPTLNIISPFLSDKNYFDKFNKWKKYQI